MIKGILKGMVIGLANILPGVSGGTMAVSMGIYDKLIHCVTHLFSEFKKSVLFLLPIGIGMVIAIIGSVFGIEYLFNTFPVQASLLFIGLILGGLPAIWGKIKGNPVKFGHIVTAVLFFALIVVLGLIGEGEGRTADLTINAGTVLMLFVIGVIASATMVIPGVSGSMILLLLGYYNPILNAISTFLKDLVKLNWDGIWNGVGILLPFGIGIIVGIFVIAKIIEVIFEKAPMYAYWAIVGLIVSSPVAILCMSAFPVMTGTGIIVNVLTGIVALVIGYMIALKLGE